MARNFFTGGSMPSFDTFLFFQKHLAIKNTWMINGVHYSKVSSITNKGSPDGYCPIVKSEFRHLKPGSICSKKKKPKSRKFLQKLMVPIKSFLIWTIGNYFISCQAKHSDTTVEMIGVLHIILFNVTNNEEITVNKRKINIQTIEGILFIRDNAFQCFRNCVEIASDI